MFSHETINSEHYVILSPFFDQLTDEEKLCGHFMQDNATAYTVSNPMHALDEVFIEQDIS
jgi:hypothetical protein